MQPPLAHECQLYAMNFLTWKLAHSSAIRKTRPICRPNHAYDQELAVVNTSGFEMLVKQLCLKDMGLPFIWTYLLMYSIKNRYHGSGYKAPPDSSQHGHQNGNTAEDLDRTSYMHAPSHFTLLMPTIPLNKAGSWIELIRYRCSPECDVAVTAGHTP